MSYSISVPGDDDATTTDLNRCLPINLREKTLTGGAGNLNLLRILLILKPVLLLIRQQTNKASWTLAGSLLPLNHP